MPESDELNATIGHIKYKVDSIDKDLDILLKFSGKAIVQEYITVLTSDPIMEAVYLQVDGQKTQQQIAQTISSSDPTVSRRISKLVELDLIELDRQTDAGRIYRYTKMEHLYKLSKLLTKEQTK